MGRALVLVSVLALSLSAVSFAVAACGDDTLDGGEQCDDGNVAAGDCCSPTCQYDAPGTACANEGNPCTSDTCNATGTCEHNVPPPGSCSGALSGKSTFLMKKNAENYAQQSLTWKWIASEPVAKSDFGVPGGGSTAMALCLSDGVTTRLFPTNFFGCDESCVKETSAGYVYKHAEDTVFGKATMTFKSGDAGKAKIQVKGKGENLNLLFPNLTLNAPFFARLVRLDSPICWEAVYSSTIQNDEKVLKAKSD